MGDQNRNCDISLLESLTRVMPTAPPLSLLENGTLHHQVSKNQALENISPGAASFSGNPYHIHKGQETGKSGIECSSLRNFRVQPFSANVQIVHFTPPPDAVDDDREPTAPPLELMDVIVGYEDATFNEAEIPPPLLPAVLKTEEQPLRPPLPNIPCLTEREVRQALLKEVASHCCYGSRAARDMAVTDIKHSIAFHYSLETFTEKRRTCWAFEPYTGGPVSSPSSGSAPSPWEIPVAPPHKFSNSLSQVEVPYTASVKTCHICGGVGRKRCTTCSSNGWEYCYSCHGDGTKPTSLQGRHTERCFQCHGTGRRKCWKCNGDGMAACKYCAGTGQIKCFIQLNVEWINHLDDYVVEKTSAIQREKLRLVNGKTVFTEEEPILWPLNHFPDTTINMASVQLLQQHATSFAGEKVLLQRQRVRVIPIAAVSYKWKSHEGLYYVYGYEQKVYAPDYPQTCCCCNIL